MKTKQKGSQPKVKRTFSSVSRSIISCVMLINLIIIAASSNGLSLLSRSLMLDSALGSKENPFDDSTAFTLIKSSIEKANDGDSFYFKGGSYQFDGSIIIKNYINIIGVENGEIDFSAKENSRHYEINSKSSIIDSVSFENITFSGSENAGITASGGLSITSGQVKVSKSTFVSNKSARGGAILSTSNDLVEINRCSFTKNEATSRGGAVNAVNANITNSSIMYNSSSNSGGGIYLSGNNSSISFCTVYANFTTVHSGGVYSSYDFKTCNGNIIVGNSAGSYSDLRVSNNELAQTGFTGAPNYNIIGYNIEKEITENSIFDIVEENSHNDTKIKKFIMIKLNGKAYNCYPKNNDISILKVDQRGYPRGENAMDEYVDIGAIEFRSALGFKIGEGYINKLESDDDFSVLDYTSGLWDDKIVNYSSSNETVATVNNSGTVAILNKGKTNIKLTTLSGEVAVCELSIGSSSPSIENIIPSKSSIDFEVGETQRLTVTAVPHDAEMSALSWSSSDTDVATVSSDGFVSAVGQGSCDITVKIPTTSISATCKVVVSQPITGISLSLENLSLFARGNPFVLEYTIRPNNSANLGVTWSSSAITVATVNSSGEVMPISKGTCVITVKTSDNKHFATCEVTVKQPVTGISLSETNKSSNPGDNFNLVANVLPENAEETINITWHTSDSNLALVNNSGNVTITSSNISGVVEITAKSVDERFSDKCVVEIKSVPINMIGMPSESIKTGESFTLSSNFPFASYDGWLFDSDIFDVSFTNGSAVFTAKKPGISTIKYTFGDEFYQFDITVQGPSTVTTSRSPSVTPTVTPSVTPTVTPSVTPTVTPSVTPTVTPSVTPTVTPSVTPTVTPSVTPTVTPSVTPTVTPSVTPTISPSVTSGNTRTTTTEEGTSSSSSSKPSSSTSTTATATTTKTTITTASSSKTNNSQTTYESGDKSKEGATTTTVDVIDENHTPPITTDKGDSRGYIVSILTILLSTFLGVKAYKTKLKS